MSSTLSMPSTPDSPLVSSPSTPQWTLADVANLFVKMKHHRPKSHHVQCASGDRPQTHASLLAGEGAVSEKRIPLVQEDLYTCANAVDVTRLLRASRMALLEKAEALGGNVLVDEHWTYDLCGPRHRTDNTYKVNVRYTASAARSDRRDPRQPIALDKAQGVPGLMTILDRE